MFLRTLLATNNKIVNRAAYASLIGAALTTAVVWTIADVAWKASLGQLLSNTSAAPNDNSTNAR